MQNIGLKRGTVKLQKWSPSWRTYFERESSFLRKLLGDKVIDIQHIGSTAVEGLVAKPIIDMLMGVKSLEIVKGIGTLLKQNGYEYRANGSEDGQIFYVKGSEDNRTHYLHIVEVNSDNWDEYVLFRDYLLLNKKEKKAYNDIKRDLAEKHADDREMYTKGKAKFVSGIIKRAKG